MTQKISIQTFANDFLKRIIIDVRSPIEFLHAHIPNAINIPLFSNEERVIVGTTYKQKSREDAIKIGLDFFGKKMRTIVEEVEKITKEETQNDFTKELVIYCARGGMRSAAIAWLLNLYGFKVNVIIGGYKSYRNWTIKQFEIKYDFKILGGFTGSRKTIVLNEISSQKNIIDLEDLANHKGSAFGDINMPKQPSQEMFENKLALELFEKIKNELPIILEDESQRIGNNIIPNGIWNQMRLAPVFFLMVSFEDRLQNIIKEYGNLPKEKLAVGITKISKRLGGLETKNAILFLEENNLKECFTILLKYYDKYYQKGIEKRDNDKSIITKCTLQELTNLLA